MGVLRNGFGLLSLRPTGAYGGYRQWLRGEKTWAEIVANSPMAGIYQRNRYGKTVVYTRKKFYKPSNPRTVPQQARRSIFSDGVVHWQGLTDLEKTAYNKRAARFRMSGFNLHQSEWLKSH